MLEEERERADCKREDGPHRGEERDRPQREVRPAGLDDARGRAARVLAHQRVERAPAVAVKGHDGVLPGKVRRGLRERLESVHEGLGGSGVDGPHDGVVRRGGDGEPQRAGRLSDDLGRVRK